MKKLPSSFVSNMCISAAGLPRIWGTLKNDSVQFFDREYFSLRTVLVLEAIGELACIWTVHGFASYGHACGRVMSHHGVSREYIQETIIIDREKSHCTDMIVGFVHMTNKSYPVFLQYEFKHCGKSSDNHILVSFVCLTTVRVSFANGSTDSKTFHPN